MFSRLYLFLVGLALVMVGGFGLIDPKALLAAVDMNLQTVSSFNEARANYGGMMLLLGIFCWAGAVRTNLHNAAILFCCLMLGGLAIGRGLSLVLDGLPNQFAWDLLAFEFVGAMVAAFLLTRPAAEVKPG